MSREDFLAELDKLQSCIRDLHVIVDAGKAGSRHVKPVRRQSTGLRHEAK